MAGVNGEWSKAMPTNLDQWQFPNTRKAKHRPCEIVKLRYVLGFGFFA